MYSKRITRATIYDVRFPHIDFANTFEDGVPEILKLQPLQEKMLVENRDVSYWKVLLEQAKPPFFCTVLSNTPARS